MALHLFEEILRAGTAHDENHSQRFDVRAGGDHARSPRLVAGPHASFQHFSQSQRDGSDSFYIRPPKFALPWLKASTGAYS